MQEVILAKITRIDNSLARVSEIYAQQYENLENLTKQDSIIMNIQRACEASIDLAMHIVSDRKLGVPKASRDAFLLLQDAGLIDEPLAKSLMNMVSFRNIAVHDYQTLDLSILETIIEKHLDDFKVFTRVVIRLEEN